MEDLFIGIDLGTQGIRILVVDSFGKAVTTDHESWPLTIGDDGCHEQNALLWWDALKVVARRTIGSLSLSERQRIAAISVASTSGTIVPVDAAGMPTRGAILYSDRRSYSEAESCNELLHRLSNELGFRFRSTFGLPKILWIRNHEPQVYEATRWFLHPTDFIIAKLSGEWGVTDQANALKSGYNVLRDEWDAAVDDVEGLRVRLPRVVQSGTQIGEVGRQVAAELDLDQRPVAVVAGVTDSNAAHLASGAIHPGQWTTSYGTSLGVKGVSRQYIKDADGALYCHKHPEGFWLPGGASNVGGASIVQRFGAKRIQELSNEASNRRSSIPVVYPLIGKGDWFPFWSDQAEGFVVGTPKDELDLFVGYLEGIAFIERLSLEVVKSLGAEVSGEVRSTGGGNRSGPWVELRSSVLKRSILHPQVSEPAMGAAILAAWAQRRGDLSSVVESMVSVTLAADSDRTRESYLEDKYQRFVDELVKRGYMSTSLRKNLMSL